MANGLTVQFEVDWSDGARIVPPAAGFDYWNYFGGDEARTGRNLVTGGKCPVVGDPAISALRARFQHAQAYVDTGLFQSAGSMTMICVMQGVTDDGYTNYAVGNANVGYHGASIVIVAGTAGDGNVSARFGVANAAGSYVSANITASGVALASPNLYVGTYDAATGIRRMRNLTTGLSITATDASGVAVGAESYLIGSKRGGSGGYIDIYMAAIASKLLSDSDIDACSAAIRAYYARRGLTV